jgi:anti-sigma regulatory factor (Ser/Thr protein kinase)
MPYYRCPACGLTVHSSAVYAAARTCPDCSAALPDDSKVYPAPGARRSVTRVFPAQPAAVGKARRTVVGLPVNQATRDTLSLLVSELVTNAIRHAGLASVDPITVQISTHDDRVRVAVHDGGPGFTPRANDGGDLDATGGRGCTIVAALSDAWGVEHDLGGCTVWCELRGTPPPPWTSKVMDAYVGELAIQMAAPPGSAATA